MIAFVLLSLPVFGVVAVGWAAARSFGVGRPALDALGAFSFRFALPALALRLIAGQPLGDTFEPRFYAGYLAAGALVFGLVLLTCRVAAKADLPAASALATTATVSNVGFLGPPLMLAFFGERGAGPLAMAILAEVAVLLSLGSMLMGTGRGTRIGPTLWRGTVGNPVVGAILAGAAMAGSGVGLPDPIDRFLAFLGGAAGPTALFALGGTVALRPPDRSTMRSAALVAAVKLAAYPAVVGLVLGLGLGLDPFWVKAGIFLAALPTAGNIYVLAQQNEAAPETVSAAIVTSTFCSVAVSPLLAWLLLS